MVNAVGLVLGDREMLKTNVYINTEVGPTKFGGLDITTYHNYFVIIIIIIIILRST